MNRKKLKNYANNLVMDISELLEQDEDYYLIIYLSNLLHKINLGAISPSCIRKCTSCPYFVHALN